MHNHHMWAGRPFYVFDVHVASHDELQRGVVSARITRIVLVRETGSAWEYQEAEQTAALIAAGKHNGMPTMVSPVFEES